MFDDLARCGAVAATLWLLSNARVARADADPEPANGTPAATIAQIYDLVGTQPPLYAPRYTFANPFRADGFTRFTTADTEAGGTILIDRLWFGSRSGRAYFLPDLQLSILASVAGNSAATGSPSTILSGTFLRMDDEYLCREGAGGLPQFLLPVTGDLEWLKHGHGPCLPESTAYFVDLATVDWRPTLGHFALRFFDGGLSKNFLLTGRTRQAFQTLLELKQGVSLDLVAPGDTSALNRALVFRLDEAVRLAIASTGGAWRASLEAHYRPRPFVADDSLSEVTAGLTRVFVISPNAVLAVTLKGGFSYADRPWLLVSSWADPTQHWSAVAGIELTWSRRTRSFHFPLID